MNKIGYTGNEKSLWEMVHVCQSAILVPPSSFNSILKLSLSSFICSFHHQESTLFPNLQLITVSSLNSLRWKRSLKKASMSLTLLDFSLSPNQQLLLILNLLVYLLFLPINLIVLRNMILFLLKPILHCFQNSFSS